MEHVQAGESYLKACIRGFNEGLNLTITSGDLKFVATSRPHSGLYYFDTLVIYTSDKMPSFNPTDFTDYAWLSLSELRATLDGSAPAKSNMKYWVKFLTKF